MIPIELSALISPMSVEDFLASQWPDQPLLVHGRTDLVQNLSLIPMLSSLEVLLHSWTQSVQVHLPDVSDEASSIDVAPAQAKKLFANQMALLFNNVESLIPELSLALKKMAQDLGLPHSTQSRCMVYATPDQKGTSAHFDQNINFVLQLQGTKHWRLARNTHVLNPTQRFTIGQPIDPELNSYVTQEFPTSLPAQSIDYVLEPGSLLFVPRGYWHSTSAVGDCLALNFTFSQPTWADIFTLALRSRLLLSPEWRALADGVSSKDPQRKARANSDLDHLLVELISDLPNWNASDILNATEGD